MRDKLKNQTEHPPECFATRLWESSEELGLDLKTIAYGNCRRMFVESFTHSQCLILSVCGTAFEAGTDTTAGTLLFFVVAMLHYPEVLKRAQAEIDSVVGPDGSTIPGFIHMNDLPYCFALTKEVFRYALFRVFFCASTKFLS